MNNQPIPGLDATWIAYCPQCGDWEMFASRGGHFLGGIEHCYNCGHEQETKGLREEDIENTIRACQSSWSRKKKPLIPYNWHTLTEEERWKVLGMNTCT